MIDFSFEKRKNFPFNPIIHFCNSEYPDFNHVTELAKWKPKSECDCAL
jgi:hypothetical protein